MTKKTSKYDVNAAILGALRSNTESLTLSQLHAQVITNDFATWHGLTEYVVKKHLDELMLAGAVKWEMDRVHKEKRYTVPAFDTTYTIQASDVGKKTIKAFGRTRVNISDIMGIICKKDVGKQISADAKGDVLGVENDEQRNKRLNIKSKTALPTATVTEKNGKTQVNGLSFTQWWRAVGYKTESAVPTAAYDAWQNGDDPADWKLDVDSKRWTRGIGRELCYGGKRMLDLSRIDDSERGDGVYHISPSQADYLSNVIVDLLNKAGFTL